MAVSVFDLHASAAHLTAMTLSAFPGVIERRRRAVAAVAATDALERLGVNVLVTGSLARGMFGPHSDVDLLVTACPRDLKYAIEGIVEDELAGLPFDVTYLDELQDWKVPSFTGPAVHASQLR